MKENSKETKELIEESVKENGNKKYKLIKELLIPAGVNFTNIDGCVVTYVDNRKHTYINGNFEAEIGLSKDTMQSIIIDDDFIKENPDMFKEIK